MRRQARAPDTGIVSGLPYMSYQQPRAAALGAAAWLPLRRVSVLLLLLLLLSLLLLLLLLRPPVLLAHERKQLFSGISSAEPTTQGDMTSRATLTSRVSRGTAVQGAPTQR